MSIASPAISFDHSDSMATITIGVSDYVLPISTPTPDNTLGDKLEQQFEQVNKGAQSLAN
jgi:hypothetical protein